MLSLALNIMTGVLVGVLLGAVGAVGIIVALALIYYNRRQKGPAKEEPAKKKAAKEPAKKAPKPEPVKKAPVEEPVKKEPAPAPVKKEAAVAATPAPLAKEAVSDADEIIVVREGDPMPVIREPLVYARYKRSYTSRLIQTSEKTKELYSALKNELLSYKKVKSRISWGHENFHLGRNLVAKFLMRGKTLCVCLPLDPSLYEESHGAEDVSDIAKLEKTPSLIRVKSFRRVRAVSALFADILKDAKKDETLSIDYTLPYEDDQKLLRRDLIRPIKHKKVVITVEEAPKLMNDEEAKANVQTSARFSDKTRTAIVNVDTLSEYFKDGEHVTLETMLERIPFLAKKTTYIKVLARGALDKALEVEADDFSLDAVKMIVLAGGKVYRKQNK